MLSNNDKSKKKRNNNINKTELWNIFNNEVENENIQSIIYVLFMYKR